MRIGVDARSIFMPRPRGTGRNLLDAYRLIPRLRGDWQFVLYHQRDASGCEACAALGVRSESSESVSGQANLEIRQLDMPGDRFDAWFQLRLPLSARNDRVDLLHLPANAAPAWCAVPYVVTVHDLIPLKIADEASSAARRGFRRGLRRAVRGAARIIAVSNATRDDLIDEFDIAEEKISVVGWAPDTHVTAGAEPGRDGRTRARYELSRPWLLGFSGSSRRKNAFGLIEAMTRLPQEVRDSVLLVLIGCEPAEFRERLAERARRCGIASSCRFLGFVPHGDIAGLLGGARGLVMPSLYEGFGLPILDAFALDVPVMTSDVSSMPEIAGDAAVYCNPHDTESIARGIERLLDDQVAERLVRAGRRRVESFTWERTAEAICDVYEQCLSELPGSAGAKPRASLAPMAEACAR